MFGPSGPMSTPCTTPHEPKPRSHEGCPTSPLLTSTTLARQINNEDDNLSIGFRSLVGSPSTDMRAVRLNSPGVRPLSTKASLFRSPPPALTSERVAQHDRDLWAQRQTESPSLLRNIPLFRELSSSSVGFAPFSFIDDMPITTVAVSTEQPALDANDNDSLSNQFSTQSMSSLQSLEGSLSSQGSNSRRGAVDTPPSAPGAFEAQNMLVHCPAPKAKRMRAEARPSALRSRFSPMFSFSPPDF